MRLLTTLLIIAFAAHSIAQDAGSENQGNTTKSESPKASKSIFDELSVDRPKFTGEPTDEEKQAYAKWYEDNIGFGIPKPYIRFMIRLKEEAKKPTKDSRYIGQWGETPNAKSQLNLAADGTFTWDYGHSKGRGIWLEHHEGIIWIGFANTEKDEDGKEHTWYSKHFCYLDDPDTLVQNNIDYDTIYKRYNPQSTTINPNGEVGVDQPATVPESKSEGSDNP